MRQSIPSIQGFVNLDKPEGITSRRAGDLVARCFGSRVQAGHAGTLDPMATGVLPVAVGGVTRLLDLVSGSDKEYRARIRFGFATDTDDATGRPLGPRIEARFSQCDLAAAISKFKGEIMQRPPDYSAIKRGGRTAHQLARSGERVRLEPRPAHYYEIELLAFELPEVSVRTRVSKGTYIRSLARDLGDALGCGAHLSALRRTMAGNFSADRAVGLDELQTLAGEGRANEALIPARDAISGMPVFSACDPGLVRNVNRGRTPPLAEFGQDSGTEPADGDQCLVVDATGRAISLAEIITGNDGKLLLQPRKRIR